MQSSQRTLPLSKNALRHREQSFIIAASRLDTFGFLCLVVVGYGMFLYHQSKLLASHPRAMGGLVFAGVSALAISSNEQMLSLGVLVYVLFLAVLVGSM